MLRPSSLPMLAACPAFESSGSDFAELGTDRHAALKAHYYGDDSLLDLLDDESQAGVRWAADYIRCHSSSAHETVWEKKSSFTGPDFTPIEGTPDAVNGNDIFDFKWRYRDYTPQMAAYAAMLNERGAGTVAVHILYGCHKSSEKITFDSPSIAAILNPIFDNLGGAPRPCDYCGWCVRRAVCPPYIAQSKQVSDGRDDITRTLEHPKVAAWIADGCHTSKLVDDGELAGLLLTWSRAFKKIHEGIEFHAMEAATKHGQKIAGFELKERSGRKFVADTKRAYELSGLPPDAFLSACEARLNTSKVSGKLGLDSVIAASLGIKAAPAKRELEKRLAEVIKHGKTTLSLVSTKGDEPSE